jgi:hypothetical protein
MDSKDKKKCEQNAVSTEELLRLLKDTQSIEGFYKQTGESLSNISTSEYLVQLMAQHKLLKQEVIEMANLERSSGYQIFSGQRNPKRDTLLRIALVMKLSLAETQRLLKIAQRGELYPKNRRDAAVVYCIHHGLSLIDTEILLESIGEPLLSK